MTSRTTVAEVAMAIALVAAGCGRDEAPPASGPTLTVELTSKYRDRPVEGLAVSLSLPIERSSLGPKLSDTSGRVRFDSLPPGRYLALVRGPAATGEKQPLLAEQEVDLRAGQGDVVVALAVPFEEDLRPYTALCESGTAPPERPRTKLIVLGRGTGDGEAWHSLEAAQQRLTQLWKPSTHVVLCVVSDGYLAGEYVRGYPLGNQSPLPWDRTGTRGYGTRWAVAAFDLDDGRRHDEIFLFSPPERRTDGNGDAHGTVDLRNVAERLSRAVGAAEAR